MHTEYFEYTVSRELQQLQPRKPHLRKRFFNAHLIANNTAIKYKGSSGLNIMAYRAKCANSRVFRFRRQTELFLVGEVGTELVLAQFISPQTFVSIIVRLLGVPRKHSFQCCDRSFRSFAKSMHRQTWHNCCLAVSCPIHKTLSTGKDHSNYVSVLKIDWTNVPHRRFKFTCVLYWIGRSI